MLSKLAFRNVKRSARDYLVYFLTMAVVTALMFSFHTLLFSKDVQNISDDAIVMSVLIGMATFFIVLVVAWLMNYMVRFILEKRSREFGIYLLLGMKKKKIAALYIRENLLFGAGAFVVGMGFGVLLRQILMAVLYSVILMDYHIRLELNPACFFMTVACYGVCYLLAILRCRRKFRNMNIRDLMDSQRKNEEIREKNEKWRRMLLPCSLLSFLLFGALLFCYKNWNMGIVAIFLIGLVVTIYLFYVGISSWMFCYVQKKGNAVYRGENLFLLRQFASKIKTMTFTMGTLTSLFTLALLGSSVALMFYHFQNQELFEKFPFDVQVYSSDAEDDFEKEIDLLEKQTEIKEIYTCQIYENGTDQVNTWLYTHLKVFGKEYQKADGTPDREKIAQNEYQACRDYDTYMGISDYNHLRRMIGLEEIPLEEHEYLIHIKARVLKETGDFSKELHIFGTDGLLCLEGYHTEGFSQNGHNGTDYILVVPDSALRDMRPYYAELVADIKGKAPSDLQSRLEAGSKETIRGMVGSDGIMVYCAKYLVRDNLIPEMKFIISSLIFPLFYMGLVFLCVALTVLSVQQLSCWKLKSQNT